MVLEVVGCYGFQNSVCLTGREGYPMTVKGKFCDVGWPNARLRKLCNADWRESVRATLCNRSVRALAIFEDFDILSCRTILFTAGNEANESLRLGRELRNASRVVFLILFHRMLSCNQGVGAAITDMWVDRSGFYRRTFHLVSTHKLA